MNLLNKTSLKLLQLFYQHPENQYYIQEIGRLLGKKPGVFQRILNELNKDGLLLSEYKANARFFKINKSYYIYNELKSIVEKSAKLALIIFLFSVVPLYAADNSLSLDQVIKSAYKNNMNIQIQEQEINAAQSDILGATSNLLPQVDVNAGYTHNDAVAVTGAQGKKDSGIFSGFKNDHSLGLTLNQSIYSGGFNMANLNQAKVNLRVAKETLRAKKLDIEFEAKRLYYGLELAYETKKITQELVNNAKLHYEDVKNRYKQGISSKFDLLQSDVQVSLLIPELIKSQNAIELIKAELKKLLAIKQQQSLDIADRQLHYSLITIAEDDFLKQAYLNKPEMVLKILGVDISRWSIQMAKSGWRPQVNANLGYSYVSGDLGDMFNNRHNNWLANIALTMPLFDGFSTKAKVDGAKARYAQAVLTKDNVVDQIAVEIRQDCLDLKQSEAIINSQKDNVGKAQEALRIAIVSYDNGEAINLDVLDAQTSLGQIETNLSQGIYDYLMAKASLDRNLGISIIQQDVKEVTNAKKN